MTNRNGRHEGGLPYHTQQQPEDDPGRPRETLEEAARSLAGALVSTYLGTPSVEKDIDLDSMSYLELVLEIADIPQWYDYYPQETPRTDDIYSRLDVSGRVKRIGITNIPTTLPLRISPGKTQKNPTGFTTERTTYELPLWLKNAWEDAMEMGVARPAGLATLAKETAEEAKKEAEKEAPDDLSVSLSRVEGRWRERLSWNLACWAYLEKCKDGTSGTSTSSTSKNTTSKKYKATTTQTSNAQTSNSTEKNFTTKEAPHPSCDTSPPSSLPSGSSRSSRFTSFSSTFSLVLPFLHMDLSKAEIRQLRRGLEEDDNPYAAALREAIDSQEDEQNAEETSENKSQVSENSSQLSANEPTWTPGDLTRTTCQNRTREIILNAVPGAQNDPIMRRYAVFVLFSDWDDEDADLQVLPNEALIWMSGGTAETGLEVIHHIQEYVDLEYLPHIPNRRCRLIRKSGISYAVRVVVRGDLKTPVSEHENRVYVVSGKPYTAKKVTKSREELREGLLEERHRAPSPGAQKTFEHLNFGCGKDLRSGRLHSKMKDHIDLAYEYVRQMNIDPEVSKDDDEEWREWRQKKREEAEKQRRQYRLALRAIEDQHQPFYGFSEDGRTDRVFGFNRSILDLPKEVRAILCQDFLEVDLKSAHLLIAAWLWDASEAMEKLADDDFSIWDDLMEHYAPLFEENGFEVPEKGDGLYATVKAALKIAVYSTVYGMPASSIQAEVTKSLKEILGEEAGKHLRKHPIIAELLEKRDEKLKVWNQLVKEKGSHTVFGPTGIKITMDVTIEENKRRKRENTAPEPGVDARSGMATLAQSYEQAAMQVILEMERDREGSDGYNYFNVALWLHDGAYVRMRSKRARRKDLNRRLEERCKELAAFAGKDEPMPAFFEIEEIAPPPLPKQDEDTETCQNNTDPNSTSSKTETAETSAQTETADQQKRTEQIGAPREAAPGAESRSGKQPSSPDSGTSTAGASRSSDEDREDERRAPDRESEAPGPAEASPPQPPETSTQAPGASRSADTQSR